MTSADPPASIRALPALATDAALLSATIAALLEKLRRGGHADLDGLASQVAALCCALAGTPRDESLACQLLGLHEELQRLVADLDADLGGLRRELVASGERLAAARAYQLSRREPP
jgi:hypothetical protein